MLTFYKKQTSFCTCSMLFISLSLPMFTNVTLCNQNPIISNQEEVDLDLFSSSNPISVFSTLNRTQTLCGESAFKNMLKNPVSNTEILNNRQATIKELIHEISLSQKINNELKQFKKSELKFLSLQSQQDPIIKAALHEFFFKSQFLTKFNNHPLALNAHQLFQFTNLSFPLLEHLTLHFLISSAMKKKYKIGCCGSDHGHSHGHKKHHHAPPTQTALALYKVYNIIHLLIHCFGIKSLIGHAYQKIHLLKKLQQNLIATSQCIRSLNNIFNLISNHPSIYRSLLYYRDLETLFTGHDDTAKKFRQLISMLSKNTFLETPSSFSNYGLILAAYHLAQELKDVLDNAMKVIGEIDAYSSIATLYHEAQNTELKYSFAQYLTNLNPIIDIENLWNPLVASKSVILEKFDLGLFNPPHIIVTGPNAAGKSTTLKSVALLTLLSQTITIVPASSFKLTPFAKISTFIQHSDNLSTGDSLFTSELHKANNLISYLQTLPENQFCFIVFDELFKSTSFNYGQDSAVELMHYISTFKNTLSITATHFPLLTTLADTEPNHFKNYNAQVLKDDAKNLKFVLKEGKSNEQNAFNVLKKRNIRFAWK